MNSLIPYLVVDLGLVVGLSLLLVRRLSFWHPATVYLVFHFYSFTWRAIYAMIPSTEYQRKP